MGLFWVSIEVRLGNPLALVDDEGSSQRATLVGFVQELGCTARDEAAMRELVRAHVAGYDLGPDQKTELRFEEVEAIDGEELDEDLRSRVFQAPARDGVWFATSRSFFSEDR